MTKKTFINVSRKVPTPTDRLFLLVMPALLAMATGILLILGAPWGGIALWKSSAVPSLTASPESDSAVDSSGFSESMTRQNTTTSPQLVENRRSASRDVPEPDSEDDTIEAANTLRSPVSVQREARFLSKRIDNALQSGRFRWEVVLDTAFSAGRLPSAFQSKFCLGGHLLSERNAFQTFAARESFHITKGRLIMEGMSAKGEGMCVLHWIAPIGEHVRVEVTALADDSSGPCIALGGNSYSGYRIVLDRRNQWIDIDTIAGGRHIVFSRTTIADLPASQEEYVLIGEKIGDLYRAFYNNKPHLYWYDKSPRQNSDRQTFALSKFMGKTTVTRLRIFKGTGDVPKIGEGQ